MLAWAGFLTIGVILALLLSNRVAAVVALAGVPIVFALIAGFGPAEIGEFVADGLGGVVGVTVMFVFAITYFGVMRDAGLFDPLIRCIVRWAGNAPVTICVATTALAMAAHLDGAGATTFLITIPAMIPLFDRLGMSRLTLSVCVGLGAGTMNLLPWGGPTARAAATAGVPANDLWVPLIPAQLAGMVVALAIAWFLGAREARRIGALQFEPATTAPAAATTTTTTTTTTTPAGPPTTGDTPPADEPAPEDQAEPAGVDELTEEERALRRPRLMWFNAALTIAVLAALIVGVAPPELIFLVGVVVALVVNYPGLKSQTARIEAHATGAMLMATTLLAAGSFLGILEGSGMITAMADAATSVIPSSAAPGLPVIIGILGVPLSLLFGPDAFYFGVLPVLNALGEQYGVSSIEMTQAALLGQETVGFPISPLTGSFYLLVGLAGVDIGKHIKALFGWAWLVSIVMVVVALLTGVIAFGATA
ncbi:MULTISPECIES: CitMHS family transporter [unclassified Dietzia]|uniref:CitMHS family transporter n=1 Tax=unclassified Dietzia TaxID=2617939 RepID=UPI000D220584|nr:MULTISPECIES: SLC13 family permease [unclassified Dietzia]AVZ40313.1 citrate transporter [Dietzia sp. JS16-p6b]QGW25789.1 citrate transporter, CitMHS family [Dietzia sp. DQ12-45-1b]